MTQDQSRGDKRSKIVSFVSGGKAGEAAQSPLDARRKALESSLGVQLPDLDKVATDESVSSLFQPFVGLSNLGATCYMNALLQTLFATPELRQHAISFAFDVKQRHSRNVAYHLQLLFAHMEKVGLQNRCSTKALMDSFGMGGDAHREQHDVQELNRVLLDVMQEFLDRHLQNTQQSNEEVGGNQRHGGQVIQDLYRGEMLDVMRCMHCDHRRGSSMPYLDVVLPLCSMLGEEFDEQAGMLVHSLEDCLDRFVAREVIEGVECSSCGGRQPLEKFQKFSSAHLPKVMTMQLLRLQYNMSNGRRDKVLKDIRLPHVLDMGTWCDRSVESPSTDTSHAETRYRLHSIICHRGTAYHGHYYAFVCCYPNGNPEESVWYKCDDDVVTVATADDVLEYTDPAAWRIAECSDPPPPNSNEIVGPPPVGVSPSTDDALAHSLFDDDPLNILEMAGAMMTEEEATASSGRSKIRTLSGQTYYALYRRYDMPLYTGKERTPLPAYVEEQLQPEWAALEENSHQLDELRHKVSVSFWVGDVDRALTTEYLRTHNTDSAKLSSSKSAQEPLVEYKLKQMWIEADWRWSVATLLKEMRCAGSEDDGLMSDSWCVELCCSESCVVRSFHTDLGVMGAVYDDKDLLSDVCSPKRNTINHFAVHLLHQDDQGAFTPVAALWASKFQQGTSKADNPVHVFVQSSHHVNMFPIPLRHVRAVPNGCSIEDAKVLLEDVVGIRSMDQILTAVVNNEPVVRTTGILVGDPIYIERSEVGRTVGNIDLDELDENKAEKQAIVPSRAALFAWDAMKMNVECLVVPEDVEDNSLMTTIRLAPPEKLRTIRLDRRTTLRKLKSQLLREFSLTVPAHSVQLWLEKSASEPVNMEATLYTMCLGASACRAAIVHRPVLTGEQRTAEVLLMNDPIDYRNPVTLIKRVMVDVTTTIQDLISEVLPHEPYTLTDEEGGTGVRCYAIRPRIRVSSSVKPFGLPMTNPVILSNTQTRASSSDGLRIILQRIPAPEPMITKGIMVLHAHYWDASQKDVVQALGVERELLFGKEMPAFSLKEQLAELFDIPASELQAAPCKFHQIQSHEMAYTHIPWNDDANHWGSQRVIAAFPLSLDHDDIILVRRASDPWPHVSPDTVAKGQCSLGPKTSSTTSTAGRFGHAVVRSETSTKQRTSISDNEDTAAKKKARSEGGIQIRAVWDYEEEGESDHPSQATQEVSAAPDNTIADSEPNPNSIPSDDATTPSTSAPPALVDFLESASYDPVYYQMSESTCRICYGDLEAGDVIIVLNACGHLFHKDCLAQWFPVRAECPLCRVAVTV